MKIVLFLTREYGFKNKPIIQLKQSLTEAK